MKVRVEKQIGSSVLSFETGYLAKQAHAAVLAQYGDTVVLTPRPSGPAPAGHRFLPADVRLPRADRRRRQVPRRLHQARRPADHQGNPHLRLIDRPIRPLFPEGYRDEVQIQSFVLASDRRTTATCWR